MIYKEIRQLQDASSVRTARLWFTGTPTNILTTSFEGTIRLEVLTDHGKDMKIVDVMDGSIYKIPDELIEEVGNGVYNIEKLPIKDTPLLITFGDFLE